MDHSPPLLVRLASKGQSPQAALAVGEYSSGLSVSADLEVDSLSDGARSETRYSPLRMLHLGACEVRDGPRPFGLEMRRISVAPNYKTTGIR